MQNYPIFRKCAQAKFVPEEFLEPFQVSNLWVEDFSTGIVQQWGICPLSRSWYVEI